jgi:hypothetical protein
MFWTRLLVSLALLNALSPVHAEGLRSNETVDWSGNPIDVETDLSKPRSEFRGIQQAIIYDLNSHATSHSDVVGSDALPVPDYVAPPANDVGFTFPVKPADLRFGMLQSSSGSCSATYIGKRYFITAAHCIYNQGWPSWVRVVPGFDNGNAPVGVFNGLRIVAFSGFITGGDAAHDLAVIQVDRDLPASINAVPVRSPIFSCRANEWSNIFFERYYYEGGVGDQKTIQHSHIGCMQGLLVWNLRTLPGSSGSAVLTRDTLHAVYAVTRGYTADRRYGVDAIVTRAKECFIREYLLLEFC